MNIEERAEALESNNREAAILLNPEEKQQTVVRPNIGSELFKQDLKDFVGRFNWQRLPFFTISIVGIIIAIELYYTVSKKPKTLGVYMTMVFSPCKLHQRWRYFTYSFLHADIGHMLGNVSMLLLFCAPLEYFYKWWRAAFIYFFGALAGSLIKVVFYPNSFSAGASNAVSALAIACIVSLVIRWDMNPYRRAFAVAWIYQLYSLLSSNIAAYFLVDNHAAHYSHFSGAIFGLLMGLFIFRNKRSSDKEITVSQWALSLFGIGMGILMFLNIFFYDTFQPTKVEKACNILNKLME